MSDPAWGWGAQRQRTREAPRHELPHPRPVHEAELGLVHCETCGGLTRAAALDEFGRCRVCQALCG